MKSNIKGTTLIEISVFLICAMILFISVSKSISTQHQVINQMIENNNITMILDSISAKIKYNLKSSIEINQEDYKYLIKETNYQIELKNESDKIVILLVVKKKDSFGNIIFDKIDKVYKKEVILNE